MATAVTPLNTICNLARDAAWLTPFYAQVDRYPDALAGQHPIRRWEYALALAAIDQWQEGQLDQREPFQICDVGGAGSNFWQVLSSLTTSNILVLDPDVPGPSSRPFGQGVETISLSVEEYVRTYPYACVDILTCISVLEHVPDVIPFLRACHALLKPGGLLVLTMDYREQEGPDTAHFHWMRERIFTPSLVQGLLIDLDLIGLRLLGAADWTYGGPHVYDYSIASLVMVKR